MPAFWRRRSLRFWLATGMVMSILPIFASAVAGYLLYHQTIIKPLVEVSSKQQSILQPLQNMQLSLWDVSQSVIDFAIDGEVQRKTAYRSEAEQIDTNFANLSIAMTARGLAVRDINEAQHEWRALSTVSNTILSGGFQQVDPVVGEQVEEFETRINRLGHQIETVRDAVRSKNDRMYEQALASLTLSERLVALGFVVSIIGALLGIMIINRSLVSSMDQLAAGAMSVAIGDRDHLIEIQIPRELTSVADAFNLMTKRIREQEDVLEHIARTDGLTGLYNRREFDRILAEELQRAKRYDRPVSLIIGDIDHFKKFNDTHGHQAGDEALCVVAHELTENLRETDKACRFGGEEFVVVLPECDAKTARQVAERIRLAVEARVLQLDGDQTVTLTISLGVATSPNNGETPKTLLKSADSALYKSKEHGRNRVMSAV